MSREKALYQIIRDSVKDGELPGEFSLPREENDTGMAFADGALDGITVYHMEPEEMDEDGLRQLALAVGLAADGDPQQADEAFARLGESFRAVSVIDELQGYILQNTEELSANHLVASALWLCMFSSSRESVKFGLSILELCTSLEEEEKTVIRTLGLSDEFTLFAIWNMLRWENGNDEVFRLARKVHGWGRIHALERLEADTDKIREWMLLEGVENTILPDYSALTVWEKTGAEKLLEGPLSREQFAAIGRILRALQDEGPVAGISELANGPEILRRYENRAAEFPPDGKE